MQQMAARNFKERRGTLAAPVFAHRPAANGLNHAREFGRHAAGKKTGMRDDCPGAPDGFLE